MSTTTKIDASFSKLTDVEQISAIFQEFSEEPEAISTYNSDLAFEIYKCIITQFNERDYDTRGQEIFDRSIEIIEECTFSADQWNELAGLLSKRLGLKAIHRCQLSEENQTIARDRFYSDLNRFLPIFCLTKKTEWLILCLLIV